MKTIGILGFHKTAANLQNYRQAVEGCGAVPLILNEAAREEAERIDGLVIPGGVDLNPALYHEENTCSRDVDDALDSFERKLLEQACRRRLPVLGICRGHQLINVFFGGSLYQDVAHPDVHTRDGAADRVHPTVCRADSFLYEIYGKERFQVNSAHHQAVNRLGDGLMAVQVSEDGVTEAICHRELPVIAVQWHPERMCLKKRRPDTEDGINLFRFFLEMCS